MVLRVKLLLATVASHMGMLVQVLTVLPLIRLPAKAPGKAVKDGLGFWFVPGPATVVASG